MFKKVCWWWNGILKLFNLFADEMFKGRNTPMDQQPLEQEDLSYLQLLVEKVGAKSPCEPKSPTKKGWWLSKKLRGQRWNN
jgi:hypothetical protein